MQLPKFQEAPSPQRTGGAYTIAAARVLSKQVLPVRISLPITPRSRTSHWGRLLLRSFPIPPGHFGARRQRLDSITGVRKHEVLTRGK